MMYSDYVEFALERIKQNRLYTKDDIILELERLIRIFKEKEQQAKLKNN